MSEPSMLMLDEPMAGVNPALTESLLEHIVELKNEGVTVLFVEHDMHMVRRISDWVVVMAEGQIIAEGPPNTVMANTAVQDAYLGAHHDTDLSEEPSMTDAPLLVADNLIAGYLPGIDILNGCSMEVEAN